MKYIFTILSILALCSCNNTAETSHVYFGGEIVNPNGEYVLLYKDDHLIDSIQLSDNNRFLVKLENLEPGLYNFRHDEYQYVYLEPQDSIFLRLNTIEFDESLTFTGKGAIKNNFIIKTFLANEEFNKETYQLYKLPPKEFASTLDKKLAQRLKDFDQSKEKYQFSEGFSEIAKAHIIFNFYLFKEYYPTHQSHGTTAQLPVNYYDFRDKINLNEKCLGSFYPYYDYVYALAENITFQKHRGSASNNHKLLIQSIKFNETKLNVIDSLIENNVFKNKLLKRAALQYLTKIDCKFNANAYLTIFKKVSTNNNHIRQISRLVNTIDGLQKGNKLVEFEVIDHKRDTLSITSLIDKPTVLFFWTYKFPQHLKSVHKKVKLYQQSSGYNFVGLSIDHEFNNWNKIIQNFNPEHEYLFVDQKYVSERLLIHDIHKIIVLNAKGEILNTDLNIFDPKFEEKLKKLK